MGVGSSFWRRVVIFVCLFVCLFVFQLPRWVIILFLSLTSGWGFFFFFFFKMFNFPTIYLGSGFNFFSSPVGKVFCFLLFLFVCFYLILFCFVLFFVLLPTIPPPWYQMVRPYPYSITQIMVDITSSTILNSRAIQWKMLFPIWNFTNTFIQECKIIWEFQIRWGRTPQTFMEIMEIFKGILTEVE